MWWLRTPPPVVFGQSACKGRSGRVSGPVSFDTSAGALFEVDVLIVLLDLLGT